MRDPSDLWHCQAELPLFDDEVAVALTLGLQPPTRPPAATATGASEEPEPVRRRRDAAIPDMHGVPGDEALKGCPRDWFLAN